MKNYVIFVIIPIILMIILFLSRYWVNKRTRRANNDGNISNIIRQPKVYLYIGIGGIVIFLGIALFFLFAPERMIANYEDGIRLPIFFVFLIICMPYIFFIIIRIIWKIEIGESEFTYRNIFGRKRTFKYDEIKMEPLKSCTRFYCKDKYIMRIFYHHENWNGLEKAIQVYKKQKRIKQQQNDWPWKINQRQSEIRLSLFLIRSIIIVIKDRLIRIKDE